VLYDTVTGKGFAFFKNNCIELTQNVTLSNKLKRHGDDVRLLWTVVVPLLPLKRWCRWGGTVLPGGGVNFHCVIPGMYSNCIYA